MARGLRLFLLCSLGILIGGIAVVGLAPPTSASADAFTYQQVSVGYHRTCAVTTRGDGLCWGWNHNGTLGTLDTASTVTSPSLVRLSPGQRFVAIDAGQYFMSCGLVATAGTSARGVICWGEGGGRGYIVFPDGVSPTSLSVGATQACSLGSDDALYCWGGSTDDAVGVGPREPGPANIAQRVPLPSGARPLHVSAGIGFTCAATTQDAHCWGGNGEGQLGTNSTTSTNLPVAVHMPSPARLVSVSAGLDRACGVDSDGRGWCWGRNYSGALGDDTYANSRVPRPVATAADISLRAIDTGWYHTCAVTTTGAALCWGDNGDGQLATDNTYGGKTLRPVALPADSRVSMIDAGLAVTCLVDQSGVVHCAGVNYRANLGRGHTSVSTLLQTIVAVGTPGFAAPSATSVGTHNATVVSTLFSFGAAASASIEYSRNSDFTASVSLPIPPPATRRWSPPSLADRTVSADLVGLQPRTTYFARFVGTNTFGTGMSPVVSFTTRGDAPVTGDTSILDISGHSVLLGLSVQPNELPTSVVVHLSPSGNPTDVRTIHVGNFGGAEPVAFTAEIDNLDARTAYSLLVEATNELGTSLGSPLSVTTVGDVPVVTATSAVGGRRSAVVTADIVTNATRVAVRVEYGRHPDSLATGPSTAVTNDGRVTFDLAGLDTAADYVFRVVASNNLATVRGSLGSFRTRGGPPVVTPAAPLDITARSASIPVTVDANEARTFVKAHISDSSDFADYDEQYLGLVSPTETATFTLRLADLAPRSTHHVRFVASNTHGSTVSANVAVTTPRAIGIDIDDGSNSTTNQNVLVHVEAPADAVAVALSNAANFFTQRVFELPAQPISWMLAGDLPGNYVVHGRFLRADGSVIATFTDSILLTTTPATPPVVDDNEPAAPEPDEPTEPEPEGALAPLAATTPPHKQATQVRMKASPAPRKVARKRVSTRRVTVKKVTAKKAKKAASRPVVSIRP